MRETVENVIASAAIKLRSTGIRFDDEGVRPCAAIDIIEFDKSVFARFGYRNRVGTIARLDNIGSPRYRDFIFPAAGEKA